MSERVRVPVEAAGQRVDRFVAAHLGLPRSQVQRAIDEGRLRLAAGPGLKPSLRLAGGEELEWEPAPRPAADDRLEPEHEPLQVLWSDPHLLVLDKPAGLAVHPGAGRRHGTLVHRLLAHYPELAGVGGPGRPGIVHRLDKDTSGALAVARSDEAYRRLAAAFAGRSVDKRYLAICHGRLDEALDLAAPIGRHPTARKEMAVRPGGRPARTRVQPLATTAAASLLFVQLLTGRTHQIRVHLKHAGHPLVGDPVYGEARWKAVAGPARRPLRDFPRPALHAWRLAFDHPMHPADRVEVTAPVPGDLAELWQAVAGEPLAARLRDVS